MAGRYLESAPVSSPYRGGILRGRELRRIPAQRFRFSTHQVREGDRIDLLAAKYYGDVRQWWRICDANPEIIDWFWLPHGTMLRIPDLMG